MSETCVVYHGVKDASAFRDEQPRNITWRPADELLMGPAVHDEPAVLIADRAIVERISELRTVPAHVVIVAADDAAERTLGDRADLLLDSDGDAAANASLLGAACRLAWSRWENASVDRSLARTEDEFHELSRIGIALMHEHDRTTLVNLIIDYGKQITGSDGGGVLLLGTDEDGAPVLRPLVFKLDSLPDVETPTVSFPVGHESISGYAAYTKKPVVVEDAEALPPGTPFVSSQEFMRKTGYPARSMLAVPMITQRDEVLGVMFFINRKSEARVSILSEENAARYIVPFDGRHERLALSLSSIAAVSMENARLYRQIEHILESFVKAAVSAVDARDPTTAGHSLRVAALTVSLAEAVEHTTHGPYRGTHFTPEELRELRFAALLHDIGKVAVREDVLVKAKKLPPVLWERVEARFALIRRTIELEHCRKGGDAKNDASLAAQLRELDQLHDVVRVANEPDVLPQAANTTLAAIAARRFTAADGQAAPWITPDELRYLQLGRGTLDDQERAEVESHAEKTHQFLNQIPWTEGLKDMARYASGHHEKLNGSGYPKRLMDKEIPLQTRLITLADVFDALTSSDRPYKPAVPVDKALEIIRGEANEGLLDPALVDIMTESQVYKRILGHDWREL